MTMIKSYRELQNIQTFEERYNYLRLYSRVGDDTFGYDRYLNQLLYRSQRWLAVRDAVIIRDFGRDLGVEGYELNSKIIVHHMNPITIEDIAECREHIFNPEFLITTSHNTHNAIHFGDAGLLLQLPKERKRNDTCPWR